MSRDETILQHLKRDGLGLEIGPSHNPIARKSDGYNVHIMDHMSREQLIEKYREHSVNLDNIEEVDFIWHGESYEELTAGTKQYDWIIASHLIEHTPDLIGFLNDCATILKDDGVICLAIPDKRYCFDHFRPLTGLSQIIDSHLQKHTYHTPGTVAEYFLNVVTKSGQIAWDSMTQGEYGFVHGLEDATRGMKSVIDEQAYMDVHAWCFSPHSFRLIIQDLFSLGLINVQEVAYHPTVAHEFFIVLSKRGAGVKKSRMELLSIIGAENED